VKPLMISRKPESSCLSCLPQSMDSSPVA